MATTKDREIPYDSPPIFGDLNLNVSLTDFTGKESDLAVTTNYCNRENVKKHEMTLDLSLGGKVDHLFCADQTPTPTRLINNCEEVGLFEDLRHVNPFDEGFRRAAEQNSGQTPITPVYVNGAQQCSQTDGDSLHTPQVYPLDATTGSEFCGNTAEKISENSSPIDVAELLGNVEPNEVSDIENPLPQVAPLQIIQPQVITWVIPSQIQAGNTETARNTHNTAIPVQTVRPFILPKPAESTKPISNLATKQITTPPSASKTAKAKTNISITLPPVPPPHEPSSASLTPTSQLPIKERLKAILNNNNRLRNIEEQTKVQLKSKVRQPHRDDDCMARRRAAATRYRNKIRNEHKDLRQRNEALQADNKNLRQRVKELEQLLRKQNTCQCTNSNMTCAANPTSQIQIPPSSIHLVINVPKLVVPASETMNQVQQPIPYRRLEKK